MMKNNILTIIGAIILFFALTAYSATMNLKLGAVYTPEATTFSIWSPTHKDVKVRVNGALYNCIKVDGRKYGLADIYSVKVPGDLHLTEYQFIINGKEVRDPYGVMVAYGAGEQKTIVEGGTKVTSDVGLNNNIVIDLRRTDLQEGWHPLPPLVNREDSIIYEVHVRDFTIDASSGVASEHRGKFLGMVQKGTRYAGLTTGIDHLKELGITHVQIMPIYDFATRYNHSTNENYNWGYDPANYNTPEDRYATNPYDYVGRIKELKKMINELHKNGIRVILDVVYNHSFWDEKFENITPKYFDGRNLSGTGNSLDTGNKMVSRFIRDSMEFWIKEYNVDGFRHDLLGIFHYEEVAAWGKYLNSKFPNRNLLIYGEPWNGAYGGDNDDPQLDKKVRLGKVPAMTDSHIGVFNDQFRNALKGYDSNGPKTEGGYIFNDGWDKLVSYGIKGSITAKQTNSSLDRLWLPRFAGDPEQSINYVSSHDNLCLWDKILRAGIEGDYAKAINKLAMGIVITSQGIPFIHSGDEMLRSKYFDGNWDIAHNSYMWGDKVNKIRWSLKAKNLDIYRYYKEIINIRRQHSGFRMDSWEKINQNVHTHTRWGGKVIITDIDAFRNNDTWSKIRVVYNSSVDYYMNEGGWEKVFGEGPYPLCKGTAITIYRK